jgi:CHAD domain-containing protein
MRSRKPLLDRPATEVAFRLARDDLDRWAKARKRLTRPDAPDAIHDFRVALRRLRSTLRAFRSQLNPSVPRRTRRRLRRLAKATGKTRNLQVAREWVVAQLDTLGPAERMVAHWLVASLAVRQRNADARLARRVAKDFARLKRKLRRSLKSPGASPAAREPAMSASVVVRDALRRRIRELDGRLRAIHTVADWDDAHAARICVKRTRYLLKPFKGELAAGGAIIEQLTALQDVLGALQDARVLADELRAGFGEVAAERARRACDDLLPWTRAAGPTVGASHTADPAGLVTLARRLGAEYETTFARLRREWLQQRAGVLLFQLRQLGSSRNGGRQAGSRVLGSRPARRRRQVQALPTK